MWIVCLGCCDSMAFFKGAFLKTGLCFDRDERWV